MDDEELNKARSEIADHLKAGLMALATQDYEAMWAELDAIEKFRGDLK